MMGKLSLIVIAAISALFALGCGGGGTQPEKSPTPPRIMPVPGDFLPTDSTNTNVTGGLRAELIRSASGLTEGVRLTWDRQADAAGGYNAYRDTASMDTGLADPDKKVNASAIANPGSGDEVTWDDIYFGSGSPPAEGPPQVGETYYYRVTNINDTSDESDVSNELSITIGTSITGFNPGSASILDTIEVQGEGFGTQAAGDAVEFSGPGGTWIDASVNTWTDTNISVVVPTGAITGHVRVILEATQIVESTDNFTVVAPAITNVNPGSGRVGDTVTITGTNFESNRGTANGKVFFGSQEAASGDYVSWTNTEIQVNVPTGSPSNGDITVKTGNNTSGSVNFDVLPKITSLSVSQGVIGSSVTINGHTFGASQGNSFVQFGSTNASITSWNNTSITATVPSGISGQVAVKVTVKANVSGDATEETLESNTLNFNVKPSISGLDGTRKTKLDQLVITGNGFGASRGASTVWFDNGTPGDAGDDSVVADGDYVSWSQTSITIEIPDSAKTGSVYVRVASVDSSGSSITIVLPPPNLTGGGQI